MRIALLAALAWIAWLVVGLPPLAGFDGTGAWIRLAYQATLIAWVALVAIACVRRARGPAGS